MGSLTNSVIMFLLPQMFYLKLCTPAHLKELPWCNKEYLKFAWVALAVIIVGGIASVVGVYFAILEML
jgi:hypothetical protein